MSAHRTLSDAALASHVIVDPGSAGTITFDRADAICEVVTATGEARTLARPTVSGISGMVCLKTDGGDLTLTVTGGYNEDGDTSIVFDTAGNVAVLRSIKVGTTYRWELTFQSGTSASTETLDVESLSLNGTLVTSTAAELNYLDGHILAGLATEAGTGIEGIAAFVATAVEKIGDLFKTTIIIDLAGLRSTVDADIIGDDGTSNPCHIGQITAARNGTIFAGSILCLELPAGGDPNIDLFSATESTGSEDDAISGLTQTALLEGGDHAANLLKSLTAYPAANEYLYLVAGATTDADYTAGILVIEMYGK